MKKTFKGDTVQRCKECPFATMGHPWTCQLTGDTIPSGIAFGNFPKSCPLPDVFENTPTTKTDTEIEQEAYELCLDFAEATGWSPNKDINFQTTTNPRAAQIWSFVKLAYLRLRETDLDNLDTEEE
jgi:hypothetical protein